MGPKVYQSALQEEVTLSGNGFKSGISFTFEPDLKEGLDYDLSIESKNKATMRLKSTRKWRQDGAGFIIAKTVTVGGKAFKLAGDDGIRVAVVLADPTITAGDAKFHETQSKVISIQGTGFTNVVDTKVIIRPTAPSAYKVLAVLENTIRVQLKPGNDWLPDFLSLKDEDENKKIPLQVTGIDTGAGEVVFDNPIQVGFIVKDQTTTVPSNPTLPKASQRPASSPLNPTPSPSSYPPTGPLSPQISSNSQHDIVLTISSSTIDVFVIGSIFGAAIVLVALYLFQRLVSPFGAHAYSPLSTSTRDGVELAVLNNNEPSHSSQSSGVDL
jgi:hypothetical protein